MATLYLPLDIPGLDLLQAFVYNSVKCQLIISWNAKFYWTIQISDSRASVWYVTCIGCLRCFRFTVFMMVFLTMATMAMSLTLGLASSLIVINHSHVTYHFTPLGVLNIVSALFLILVEVKVLIDVNRLNLISLLKLATLNLPPLLQNKKNKKLKKIQKENRASQ